MSNLQSARPVALVTGSTSGIGEAIARRLSRDGYAVVVHSRRSVEAGHALARELGEAAYVQADLANDADRVRLVREAVAAWGRLDVLVNNAGISRVIPHADLAAATPDIWHALHEVNVVAPFRLVAEAQAALQAAAAQGRPACVVNVSSHAGIRPKGASIPYAATKAPMRRAASPEDIAQAISMLVASDYLTGEVLLSDGGLNLT
jgi:NAD(P)-dependent dehydrogenase (short-subunit alcohol dehydrogenase family)